MNAAVAEVMNMVVEDRIARLEADVTEIKGDVKTLGKQFGDFKTEMAKELSSVAKEIGSVRIEMESLRTSIERNKLDAVHRTLNRVEYRRDCRI